MRSSPLLSEEGQKFAVQVSMSNDKHIALHHRLLEDDPTAVSDVFASFYDDLVDFTHHRYPDIASGIDEDVYRQAAFQAISDYVKAPRKFDSSQLTLRSYLNMAAHRDLLNLIKRENLRRVRNLTIDDVALSIPDRNRIVDEEVETTDDRQAARRVLDAIRPDLSDGDRTVLNLMAQGERRTEVFAEAIGIDHLPVPDQRREVKRRKDRIKKRLIRNREADK